MRAVATVVTVVALTCAGAEAREPRTAIAPVTTGQTCPAELQRAFADELPRTLARAGFDLVPPNEVDMRIGERPEFLQCHAGGCLAEEASFLRVRRLAVPRLERASDGGFTVGMSIYDAGARRAIADAVERVSSANAAAQLQKSLQQIALRLHAELSRPGRLDVVAEPAASISIDGVAKGQTPWSGDLAPGDHVVALESNGARVERDVEVTPAQTAHIDISLVAPPPPSLSPTESVVDRPRHRVLKPLAWTGLGVGVVAAAAGAALLALNNHGTCALPAGQLECRQVWDTLPGGIALTAVGGALAIGSIVLIATDHKR